MLEFKYWTADEAWYSKSSWTYQHVLFESFCLMKLLNLTMVRILEIVLERKLNHSV
jgi:hypothetical protein